MAYKLKEDTTTTTSPNTAKKRIRNKSVICSSDPGDGSNTYGIEAKISTGKAAKKRSRKRLISDALDKTMPKRLNIRDDDSLSEAFSIVSKCSRKPNTNDGFGKYPQQQQRQLLKLNEVTNNRKQRDFVARKATAKNRSKRYMRFARNRLKKNQ